MSTAFMNLATAMLCLWYQPVGSARVGAAARSMIGGRLHDTNILPSSDTLCMHSAILLCHPTALLQAEALVHEFTPQEIANLLLHLHKLKAGLLLRV
jgi:hypothetical protein